MAEEFEKIVVALTEAANHLYTKQDISRVRELAQEALSVGGFEKGGKALVDVLLAKLTSPFPQTDADVIVTWMQQHRPGWRLYGYPFTSLHWLGLIREVESYLTDPLWRAYLDRLGYAGADRRTLQHKIDKRQIDYADIRALVYASPEEKLVALAGVLESELARGRR